MNLQIITRICKKNHDSDENEKSMQECFGNKIIPTLNDRALKNNTYKQMLLCKECFEALKRFTNGNLLLSMTG